MRGMNSLSVIALASLCLAFTAAAGDCPSWGNTHDRNMINLDAKDLPSEWSPGKKKDGTEEFDMATTKNVKWIAKLGSQSYGNPTVAKGKVLVGTNNTSPRNPKIAPGARSVSTATCRRPGGKSWCTSSRLCPSAGSSSRPTPAASA